ncbi:MAG: DUF4369 domain-containing protein [Muribaculaceae bacterium]|nr:DUF4369 domain-containing protein [Muribaculaceae bacterium]
MISHLKNQTKNLLVLFLSVAALSSCSNNKFKIKGEIYGAGEKSLILEKSDFQGRWIPVDSTHTNKNGGFSFSFQTPGAPEIYRISLNNQYVYIPVDSTETITLTSSYEKFGQDFSLSGSRNAEMMEKFEKQLHSVNTDNPDSLVSFKRNVYSNYMKDFPGSILNYYILIKTINGEPLYNPNDNTDGKYFTAVATGYKTVRPDDPHATLLESTALNSLKQRNSQAGKYNTLEAQEISLIEIELPDESGNNIKLSEVAGKGKPIVVIFSLLNHQDSPELNIALAQIYNRLKGNVEFYNVSLDQDQYEWRSAAKNLPWITVYSPGQFASQDAARYNVYQIPTFFIYNAQGELVARVMSLEELQQNLNKI